LVLRGGVSVKQPGMPLPEEFLSKRPFLIFRLHQAAPLQHGDYAFDEIHKRTRRDRVGNIEPVHSGPDPLLKGVGDLFWRTYDYRSPSANSHKSCQIP
jgi:hypothetical protein